MTYEIINLEKDKWQGHILPIKYTTEEYYDLSVDKADKGFSINIEKKNFNKPVTHTPEEYDFPDKLYAEHYEEAYAWGVVVNNELIAAIETNPESWSNRLRITELWVADEYQKQGLGHRLIEVVKEQARRERRRAIILETQSCNVNAIDFYLHEGFTLIGFDTCCYNNNDLDRKEVRIELGYFLDKKSKLSREEVEIRMEKPEEYYDVELMTQHAFWNKYIQGCEEHYLAHIIRKSQDYLPELSRIAVKDGKIIGLIMYTKGKVIDGDKIHDVVSFGPLCVDPNWQGCGIGEMLIEETAKLAKKAGYKGIIIFGEPDYYPRVGFKTCDNYNITTSEGENFDPFMALELGEGSLKDVKGKFYGAKVFEEYTKDQVEEYNKKFPYIPKMRFPGQWE